MTLLLHSPSALPDTEDGRLLASVLGWVDERYPLAFSIVATSEPPAKISRSEYRDWVTLPRVGDLVWRDADACANEVLLAYARQLTPVATLLVRHSAEPTPVRSTSFGGKEKFGNEIIVSDENTYRQVCALLDRVLPASLVVSNELRASDVVKALDRQSTRPEIHLYWVGSPSSRVIEFIDIALTKSEGVVRLQFKLRDLFRQLRGSLAAVYPLFRSNPSRLKISIAAEEGAALKASRVMTEVLARSGRA